MIFLFPSLSLSLSLSFYRNSLGSTTNRPTKQNIGASPAGEHLQLETRVLVLWRGRGHKKNPPVVTGRLAEKQEANLFFLESTWKPTWRWWRVPGCNRRWWKVAMKVRSLFFETNLEDLFQVRVVSMFWEFRKPTLNKTRAIGLVFGALSFPEQKVGGSNYEWCWDGKFWIVWGFCQLNDGRIKKKLNRNWPLLSWALENDSNQNIRVNISLIGEFHREVTTEKHCFLVGWVVEFPKRLDFSGELV